MELTEFQTTASTLKAGQQSDIALAAGQKFQIRRYGGGPPEEVLDYECPAGRTATVRVIVEILLDDA